MKISEGYRSRTVDWLGVWEIDDWRLKVYTIGYTQAPIDERLLVAARKVATDCLARTSDCQHYSVGFIGIHQGKTGNFVFVDWWADENELHHHVYVSTIADPVNLKYMTPTGLIACVWDLWLIGFERDAWVEHILKKFKTPDIEGYLKDIATEKTADFAPE